MTDADHRAEQVLAAIYALLSVPDVVPAAATVARDHAYSYDDAELPAVNITMGEEKPQAYLLTNSVDWELQVDIDISAKQSSALTTTLNELRKEIHIALRATPTLSLSFVLDTLPVATAKPEQRDADLPIMTATSSWLVTYRSSLADPSQ